MSPMSYPAPFCGDVMFVRLYPKTVNCRYGRVLFQLLLRSEALSFAMWGPAVQLWFMVNVWFVQFPETVPVGSEMRGADLLKDTYEPVVVFMSSFHSA